MKIDVDREWETIMDSSKYWKTLSDGYTWHEVIATKKIYNN